jgi:hypothetical protein
MTSIYNYRIRNDDGSRPIVAQVLTSSDGDTSVGSFMGAFQVKGSLDDVRSTITAKLDDYYGSEWYRSEVVEG